MRKGICRLCLGIKDLCEESHIIPDFLYKFLKGDNSELVYINRNNTHSRYKSEYEGGILCEDCDNKLIGQLDNYVAKFMHGELSGSIPARTEMKDGRQLLIREKDPTYNYDKFKLFWLSVLWRSSISSRPFFEQIKLPIEIEEDIRQKLISSDPGRPDEYPFFITLPPLVPAGPNGEVGFVTMHMSTRSPLYIEKGDLRMAEFVIQGTHYYFIISRPINMNIEPSVDLDSLTMAFNTIEEQNELLLQTIDIMKKHKR